MSQRDTGDRIAARRKEKGYTQKQLAQLLHVTDKAVSKWERGDSYPETGLLVPLAAALDTTVDALLGAPPPPEGEKKTSGDGPFRPGLRALAAPGAWALAAVPLCAAGWLAGGWWGALPLALCLPPWLAALAIVLACRWLPQRTRRVCGGVLALSGALLAAGLLSGRPLVLLMPAYCIAAAESLVLLLDAGREKARAALPHGWYWKNALLFCAAPGGVFMGVALGALRYGGWQRGANWYVLRLEPWWPWLWAALAAGAIVWLVLHTARGKGRWALLPCAVLPLVQCWCLSASLRSGGLCFAATLAALAALPLPAWAASALAEKEDLQNSTNVV